MAAMNPLIERPRPLPLPERRPIVKAGAWPSLPIERWHGTYQTLHLYAQIVGKIRLALTPKMNQWWNVPFYVGTRGIRTSPMPYPSPGGDRTFEIGFDFIRHELEIADSDGRVRTLALVPALPVADFHRELHRILGSLGIEVRVRPTPSEIPLGIPFSEDSTHRTYLADDANAFFQVLRRIAPVFEVFRSRFRGKCSPVHFFWGNFDLSVTRFSGWRVPAPTGSPVVRGRYDEEMISFGFWPGDAWSSLRTDQRPMDATFYSYTVPEPAGLAKQHVEPDAAHYHEERREFLLPYEKVRTASDPAKVILQFAESSYNAGASLAGWNRDALSYP